MYLGEAQESLEAFRQRYNAVRPHWALVVPSAGGDPLTPADVYVHGRTVQLPKWQGWANAALKKLEQMVANAHMPLPAGAAIEPVA